MKHIQIAPSILSADFSAMGQAVETLQQAGADLIHCDVMDGSFVPNITFGHHMVRDIRKHTSLPLDVHLMIERPERHVENFIKAGADIVTVHHEACGASLKDVLRLIRSLGAKCGAVINPDTPLSAVYGVLEEVDICLLYTSSSLCRVRRVPPPKRALFRDYWCVRALSRVPDRRCR